MTLINISQYLLSIKITEAYNKVYDFVLCWQSVNIHPRIYWHYPINVEASTLDPPLMVATAMWAILL